MWRFYFALVIAFVGFPAQAEDWVEMDAVQAIPFSAPFPLATEIALYAVSLTGTPYKFGGENPSTGFDCSGFIRHVFREVTGLILPRSARALSLAVKRIPSSELQAGDLVFYDTLKQAYSHVGIYLGNDQFIHAASTGRTTQISSTTDAYWIKRFNGAGRLLDALSP